jgi:hypothetical protein
MTKHRDRPVVGITLSPEAIATSEELALARGWSRSQLIEFLIREEALRQRLDVNVLGAFERKKRGLAKPRKRHRVTAYMDKNHPPDRR